MFPLAACAALFLSCARGPAPDCFPLALLEGVKVSPGGFFQGSCKEREPDRSAKLRRWPVDGPTKRCWFVAFPAGAAR